MADYSDDKKSKFNAGIAQTERIHELQRAINSAKFNPLQFNQETGTFNYQILIASADCLVSEGWDKFSDKEKKEILRMNTIMKQIEKYFPPVSVDRHGEMIVNRNNYEKLMMVFERYERRLKELYGLHNLNSPTAEDDEGL